MSQLVAVLMRYQSVTVERTDLFTTMCNDGITKLTQTVPLATVPITQIDHRIASGIETHPCCLERRILRCGRCMCPGNDRDTTVAFGSGPCSSH